MASWRDKILREFLPQIARLTLVADPDGLLLEEGILKKCAQGALIDTFDDNVAFRYIYESSSVLVGIMAKRPIQWQF